MLGGLFDDGIMSQVSFSSITRALTNKFAIHPWSSGFRDFDSISGRLSVEHAAGLFPNGLAAAFYEMPVSSATNGTMKN